MKIVTHVWRLIPGERLGGAVWQQEESVIDRLLEFTGIAVALALVFVLTDLFCSTPSSGIWAGHNFSIIGRWLQERAVRKISVLDCGGDEAKGYWWRLPDRTIRLSASQWRVLQRSRSPLAEACGRAQSVRVVEKRADGRGGQWYLLADGLEVHLQKERFEQSKVSPAAEQEELLWARSVTPRREAAPLSAVFGTREKPRDRRSG